jgi:predicted DsbA family dithiol-disulfide isomerase
VATDARAGAELRVVVFGDFVCPWSYLAVAQVQRIQAEYGVQPSWQPHWLRPEVPPEGMEIADVARRDATAAWIRDVAPDAAARMRFSDRLQFSFLAFEALEFARDRGADLRFAAAVFDALWVEGGDIASPSTLTRAATTAGLDAEALDAALRSHAYHERALDAVNTARRIGVTATPTLFIGRTRINGWHYDEVVQSVLEKQLSSARPQ